MPGADDSKPFAVNLDDDGLFKSMVLPDAPKREQNVMKSWAAMLQVNRKKIRAGEKAFVSEEVSCPDISFLLTELCKNTSAKFRGIALKMFRCPPPPPKKKCIVAQYFSQPVPKPGRDVFTLICTAFFIHSVAWF